MKDYNSELIKNQRKIEALSVVTDDTCATSQWMQYLVLLGGFKAIRSLSWKGLKRVEDFRTLSTCIRDNAHGIETLVLDLID